MIYTKPEVKWKSLTPSQHKVVVRMKRRKKMLDMLAKDNKSVGDYTGMRSSIKDENETISEGYMHA